MLIYQINTNLYKRQIKNIKTINEDKTIRIIIVKKNNKFIIKYCSDDEIITKNMICAANTR